MSSYNNKYVYIIILLWRSRPWSSSATMDPARVSQHEAVVVVGEGGAALRAQVRLLPRVLPHVHLELVLPGEGKREEIRTSVCDETRRPAQSGG
jgi:hypothetical protein